MLPLQPLYRDEHSRIRFRKNAVVCKLLEHGQATGMGLNELACFDLPTEDWEQFAN